MCVLIYADDTPWDGLNTVRIAFILNEKSLKIVGRTITRILALSMLPDTATNAYRDLHIDHG